MATATSSPFTKDKIRTQLAYYFDDDRIAITQKNTTSGEWKSISEETADSDGSRLRVTYHARYSPITSLTQDINTDIGLKYGLHLALIDYIRSRIEEDNGDLQKAAFYFGRFQKRVKQFPYRKSAVRSISPYNLT
ncbi:hypothetical protein OAN76_02570 [Candidatus Marinimicrobia bacterium]|nr:hypothetical protein [Candidatus Neomarinimicrobiota bacterium]|tara:strand:- start:1971 stop:2375 length:405 start_codon:yes stop_codon:yes gene_type:complete